MVVKKLVPDSKMRQDYNKKQFVRLILHETTGNSNTYIKNIVFSKNQANFFNLSNLFYSY